MIDCRELYLKYDGKPVLEKVSLQVKKGEHVCVSGPSGKGKSTFLKVLQGYALPASGSLTVNGLELNADTIKTIRNSMAWIPQNINLPVENGIELINMLGLSEKQSDVILYIKALGLEDHILLKNFQNISVGQKQRVVIAVCLALDKDIILMDEPTAALDEVSIQQLINLIKTLKNKTIVSASHHPVWNNSADKTYAL